MPQLPEVTRVCDIQMGKQPALEAWLYHFLTENNLEYLINPSIVASPEQLRFMVAMRDDQVYLPCDDAMFFSMYRTDRSQELIRSYREAWLFIVKLVHGYQLSRGDARRILGFCRYRFRMYLASRMLLPSRMIKRLVGIVLTQCGMQDPFREKKRLANSRALETLSNPAFQRVLRRCPPVSPACTDLSALRWEMDITEISRLVMFSTLSQLWQGEVSAFEAEERLKEIKDQCDCLRTVFGPDGDERKKVLFIPDVAGGFIFDLALIKTLLRLGHQVVLCLKDAFYFNTPVIWDLEGDKTLKSLLEDAHVITHDFITKNELLRLLRENRLVIISDGTSEALNFYRVSVTFARAWKECDVVIAKGLRNKTVLLDTSHDFTRDVICYWRDEAGDFHIHSKSRAKWIRKFAEKDLLAKAKEIVQEMRAAKKAGKTVMFYSAIIGSVPGQTKTAIALVNTFVARLRDKTENIHIINPAEHFEEGMDGDDLMYMWEHVQRSGFLDVWRFQTVEDIELSFALLERKVPSIWSGKDSTFSTGCTKEMRIALDVQKNHPELQIIGPSAEKFFRRRDYGVGKYYDATLKG